MRLHQARRDLYRRLAQRSGYKSRASYKLIQLNDRYGLISKGDVVVDFGCAPGGWLQVALQNVGETGFVLGVDLRPVAVKAPNLNVLIADVRDVGLAERICKTLPRKAGCVLSDLAPNLSGVWELDHAKQIELTKAAVTLLPQLLKEGGSAVLKVFQGDMLEGFTKELKTLFERVALSKPEASRKESSELYIICFNYSLTEQSFSQHP